jgi:hypothetical protein
LSGIIEPIALRGNEKIVAKTLQGGWDGSRPDQGNKPRVG